MTPRSPVPFALLLLILAGVPAAGLQAAIPATPPMTVYRFNGPLEVPFYEIPALARAGAALPAAAGTLMQGTSLIPCLPLRDGQPLTATDGSPFVGFEVLVDPRRADATAAAAFRRALETRRALRVANHHCPDSVRHAIEVRHLYALEKAPFFAPEPSGQGGGAEPKAASELDRILRAFHASPECAVANRRLPGRRAALDRAWDEFARARAQPDTQDAFARARHLDYSMRTAIFEGHLERGCSAYGACERNIVLLSIRNRAVGSCAKRHGCRFPGDFQGVSSSVSQYNIWDEYLTQISGLTACYLRPDLAGDPEFARLQAMHEQTVGDAERILYGDESELLARFPDNRPGDLRSLRHYYHAPAMAKCFPEHPRAEYISGAVARDEGGNFALIANTRVEVGERAADGYRFKLFRFDETPERDLVRVEDRYPGFRLDARKVSLRQPAACPPYGIPAGCPGEGAVGRYRRVPSWLSTGRPVEIRCPIQDRGASCAEPARLRTARVGGPCDREMRPVTGVP